MTPSVLETLYAYRDAGVLAPLDIRFATTVARLAGEDDDLHVVLGAALASRAPRHGHVHVDLADVGSVRVEPKTFGETLELNWPEKAEWREALAKSRLVTSSPGPLVLEGHHLYLRRYWEYQDRLGAELARRAVEQWEVDGDSCRETLSQLFGGQQTAARPDLQLVAAAVAALRGLAVITGGPGTGKTYTVLRLLALLIDQAGALGRELRIALAAPTGKAAARMSESIREGKAKLQMPSEIVERISENASTLHRLLGYQHHAPTRFRHDDENPLPYDVLVVDEASMIPLSLMAKLVDAVPRRAKLILLGDRDQLASVEAGAVLGDLCPPPTSPKTAFTSGFAATLGEVGVQLPAGMILDGDDSSPLRDCLVHLEHSHRFDSKGGIGKLALEVNSGRGDAALQLLRASAAEPAGALALVESDDPRRTREALRRIVLDKYVPGATEGSEEQALGSIGRFCVLCAHRRGPLGAARLNADIEDWLSAAGRLDVSGEWYAGRPVMVTQNDYNVELFNGDIGIVLPATEGESGYRVVFPKAEKPKFRQISPGRLPAHETVFAMTVHKSQGSEFDEVVVVLPSRISPILTRELLYTGLTRAKKRVTVVGPAAVITAGIEEQVRRASGLREILWKE